MLHPKSRVAYFSIQPIHLQWRFPSPPNHGALIVNDGVFLFFLGAFFPSCLATASGSSPYSPDEIGNVGGMGWKGVVVSFLVAVAPQKDTHSAKQVG